MVEMAVKWIGANGDSNPYTGKVWELRQEVGKNGRKEYVLYIEGEQGLRRVSLWGENLNRLIQKFGTDELKWVGCRVQVLTEEKVGEKKKRFILPL